MVEREPDTVVELLKENAALKRELGRLNSSIRLRMAHILVEAFKSPRAAFTAPGRLFALLREAAVRRRWRAVTVALECGLLADPLQLSPPPGPEYAGPIRALAAAARRNGMPSNLAVEAYSPTGCRNQQLSKAFQRFEELHNIAQGEPWPLRPNGPDVVIPGPRSSSGCDVLMVLHSGVPDQLNGYTRRSHELLKALRDKSVDAVALIRPTQFSAEEEVVDGVPYRRSPGIEPANASLAAYVDSYAEAIRAALVAYRPQIVHAASNHMTGCAALFAARRASLPYFYEVRGLWETTRASVEPGYERSVGFAAQRRQEVEVARSADGLFVNGEGLRDLFVDAGVPPERVRLLLNGCDPESFDLAADEAARLRAEWGLDERSVVGFVGSLTPYEGLNDVIAASAAVQRTQPHQLLFVGDGPSRVALENAAAQSGLGNAARFVGRVSAIEAQAAYALIDIAPLVRQDTPVARLTPPLKPLEAMAGRSAMIVSDLPPLRPFAENGRGVIVPPGDRRALAETLEALLGDGDCRRSLADNARRHVERHSRWRDAAGIVAEAYGGLAHGAST